MEIKQLTSAGLGFHMFCIQKATSTTSAMVICSESIKAVKKIY